MAAIVYLRVSTEEQSESGLGLAAQLTAATATATRLGLELAGVHTDAGISGSKSISDRPALVAALGSVKRGDVLIVAKRDRIARDMMVTMQVEKELERKGARLISAAGEGTDGDSIGDMIQRRVLDLFAQVERDMTRARTKAALQAKKAKGERVGAIPYGYKLADDGCHLEPAWFEQDVIALVRSLRISGLTYRAIVEHLNRTNMNSRTGNRWQLQQIQRMITSPN
jgi:DNA invertase Pin-like site-specific DNA recombinase